jgi:CheY-like chemotaxis protein
VLRRTVWGETAIEQFNQPVLEAPCAAVGGVADVRRAGRGSRDPADRDHLTGDSEGVEEEQAGLDLAPARRAVRPLRTGMGRNDVPEQDDLYESVGGENAVDDRRGRFRRPGAAQLSFRGEGDSGHARPAIPGGFADEQDARFGVGAEVVDQAPPAQRGVGVLVERRADRRARETIDERSGREPRAAFSFVGEGCLDGDLLLSCASRTEPERSASNQVAERLLGPVGSRSWSARTAQQGGYARQVARAAILVVDDDAPIRRMLDRTLSAEGYEITCAADGAAALVAVEVSAPDAVVLDVSMPGLGGLEVCRRLRVKGLAMPILLLTARDALEDRVAGLDAGADDYLVKPFAVEELTARLRALLRRAREVPKVLAFADVILDVRSRMARRAGRISSSFSC